MGTFLISGGKKLFGEVEISGSKNAALPLLFASLVTDGVSVFHRVPDITDVNAALEILSAYGVRYKRRGDTLVLDTTRLTEGEPDESLVGKIRASTYLIGGVLGRFGRVKIPSFGGCSFCDRPIDYHLAAAKALGVREADGELSGFPTAGVVTLPRPSVGATVNALLLASRAKGKTVIRGAASERHVGCLLSYLRAAGVEIEERGRTLTVTGTVPHGAEVTVIPDEIEAATYLAAGIVTDGCVTVKEISPAALTPFLSALLRMGCEIEGGEGRIMAKRGKTGRFGAVKCLPSPGFPTDAGSLTAAVFATLAGGKIEDTVFPNRFGYLDLFGAFGVGYGIAPGSALVLPSKLKCASVDAPDLRAGAAALLLALAAEGESKLGRGEILLRGYESPTEKFSALGAEIAYL